MRTISHNVIKIVEKVCIFIMLLFHFQCAKKDDNFIMNQKDWIRLLSHPIGYFMVEDLRDRRESPYCGGDAIGTLLGMNNNRPKYEKLEENQEIISSYFKSIVYEYQARKTSIITITILEKIKIDSTSSINCLNSNNTINVRFCNGKISEDLDSYYLSEVAIGQIYSKSFFADVKYFLNIYSLEKECNLKINIKSNTL